MKDGKTWDFVDQDNNNNSNSNNSNDKPVRDEPKSSLEKPAVHIRKSFFVVNGIGFWYNQWLLGVFFVVPMQAKMYCNNYGTYFTTT